MEKKWGRLMGAAAIQEWKSHVSTLMGRPSCGKRRRSSSSSPVAIDSVMYWNEMHMSLNYTNAASETPVKRDGFRSCRLLLSFSNTDDKEFNNNYSS
ncbi:hypothetical protein DY000_02035768 [Brassica cretica]|uniref:Uncharacterized protein n=1 Tax=Brassica cretica TaxID=69181 RepID=A0ABQ7DG08_BRACR|nr:hypothetical protein DY000_02035768 [Brassica cretica]